MSLLLNAASCFTTLAQTTPATPPVPAVTPAAAPAPVPVTDPPVAPAVDAAKEALVTDTLRRPISAPGLTPDAPEKITRSLAIRIVLVMAAITLSTLLLYDVRSR